MSGVGQGGWERGSKEDRKSGGQERFPRRWEVAN